MNDFRLSTRLAFLVALVFAYPLAVDAQCRATPRTGTDWVIEASREYPATVHLSETLGEVTVSFRGTVCDENHRPINGVWGQLVRFDPPEGRTLESLDMDDFRTGAAKQYSQVEFISARNGTFEVPGLRPGDYVFLVEWPETANTDRLFFDFRISHGYRVQAQYTRP